MRLEIFGDLRLRGGGAGSGQNHARSAYRRVGRYSCGKETSRPEIFGQTKRDTRAAGHEHMIGGGFADGDKIVIADRIDDREPASRRRLLIERLADRDRTPAYGIVGDPADFTFRLQPQPAP